MYLAQSLFTITIGRRNPNELTDPYQVYHNQYSRAKSVDDAHVYLICCKYNSTLTVSTVDPHVVAEVLCQVCNLLELASVHPPRYMSRFVLRVANI